MPDERVIEEEINQLKSLHFITQAYEEIASTRMMKSRGIVLSKRDFLAEIGDVFEDVRDSYARQVIQIARSKGIKRAGKVTFLAHNGKTVSVFLSANTGLYGDILNKVFSKFIEDVRKGGSEVTIVGRQGLSLFIQEEPNRPYTYFDLPDHGATSDDLVDVVRHIVQYEKINVYYGRFVNVVNQTPTVFSISAEIDLEGRDEPKAYYIFEPTIERILMFFETEIFASLFEQSVSESELAKSASRVIAMDKAATNIKKYLEDLKVQKLRVTHSTLNKKQINSIVHLALRRY